MPIIMKFKAHNFKGDIMKTHKHILTVFVFTLINLFIWSFSSYGYVDGKQACKTLRGIETLDIIFDWDGQGMDISEYDSNKDILRKFVVRKLSEKGVKINEIYSGEKIDILKDTPFLYVEMHSNKCSEEDHTVFFDIKYFQEVNMKKDRSKSFISPTWSSGGAIHIGPVASFPELLSGLLDKFCSAYQSVN